MTEAERKKQRALRWVKALESGRFKRGRERLRSGLDGTYCVMGVACHVSRVGKWDGDNYVTPDGCHGDSYAPSRVLRYYGITESFQEALVSLNDSESWDFKRLAKLIREQLDLEAASES